jgi:hypothetical protein
LNELLGGTAALIIGQIYGGKDGRTGGKDDFSIFPVKNAAKVINGWKIIFFVKSALISSVGSSGQKGISNLTLISRRRSVSVAPVNDSVSCFL